MTQHRNSITFTIKAADHPILTDPSMRVMVFCAAANTGVQEVAFPHQAELKVNGGEIKANLRGLKNKPGSTRPVDITDQLRLKLPHYANLVEFTYALTNKAGAKGPRNNKNQVRETMKQCPEQNSYLSLSLAIKSDMADHFLAFRNSTLS